MKKTLLLMVAFLSACLGFSQTRGAWSQNLQNRDNITKHKSVSRVSFPKVYKLYNLDLAVLKNELFTIAGNPAKRSTIISLPNADGNIEEFEVYEASNFDAELQARFPQIRAFSGKGINDKYATLKLSISPQGIQTMVFRTDKPNEFIEPFSQDQTVYAVFKSQRRPGQIAWTCSTPEADLVQTLDRNVAAVVPLSSAGQMKTMRLAQSCNAEYSNYFGATSAAQVGLVLAAFNNTLTRCNGVYEKDLALHLNLVASTTNVIYYDPATDPYTAQGQWNSQLQVALNTTLTGVGTTLAANNAAYDIGHMFGADGGGGNAGCIGCVCVNGVTGGGGATKGRGITSPADGVPQGDNFDIDYVVHEIGHQLGGTHTFSHGNEGSGTNKEVGSGITIMGYAGITAYDLAPHSIDIYHQTSIAQIQANLATKSCPVTTLLAAPTGANATPVVNAVPNYTIPKSTPFVLTGSATDADAGDALTYCWEQNDDGGSSTGSASSASATKTVGPNFLSWPATASPMRYFPKISSIIANSPTTAQIGGDAGMLSEALSSVARTLNFRLTVRDNAPYITTAPVRIGQTQFTDMVVTVNGTAGPFVVNAPNTAVSWVAGTNQTVTWDVAGTTGNSINAAYVDVFLSTDGGNTYPIQLADKVPNNGSTIITVPNNVGANNRIMVKGWQNIFFDISNTNFTIAAAPSTFLITETSPQSRAGCTLSTETFTFDYAALNGFSGTTNFSLSGAPAGANIAFTPASMSGSNGSVSLVLSNLNAATSGDYNMLINATSGATTISIPLYLFIGLPNATLSSPADTATGQGTSVALSWSPITNAASYDVEVSLNPGFSPVFATANVTSNTYTVSGLGQTTTYYWRVKPNNAACSGNFSAPFSFTTGMIACNDFDSTNVPITISATGTPTVTSTLSIPAASSGTISDVNVTVDIAHTWVNDLTVRLTSPSGTIVTLVANPCASAALNNIEATFDDAGTALVCANNPAIGGTRIPNQPLSAFNGQNSAGTWTLTVADAFNQDGGAINGWSLNICAASAMGLDENQLQDLAIFPNPSNGQFTVQFNAGAENQSIMVHDVRGREVFAKDYNNSGMFNEQLALSLQSGVYMVTVQDGTKKVVKKIVVN